MSDKNNQPNWTMHPEISGEGMPGNKYGEAGNGRSWQQNELPKGARKAVAPKDNAVAGASDGNAGNGFGEYDPRNPVDMDEVRNRSWGVSKKDSPDMKNPNFEDPKITRSNPIDNDRSSSLRKNPYREDVKKEWFS